MSNAPSVRLSQKFLLALAAACLTGALFAGSASARAVTWSGTAGYGGETLTPIPQTLMLSVANGRVRIRNMQVVMACTGDISNPEIAFDVVNGPTVNLRLNRFRFNFIRSANGRTGRVQLTGTLRSNGRGNALAQVSTATRNFGGGIERCAARVNFSSLRRGPR